MTASVQPTAAIEIASYTERDAEAWDAFVMQSRNGTFFHTRRFLRYHPSDRFQDASLIMRDGGNILAVLPAATVVREGQAHLVSHPGASYGGLVLSDDCGVRKTGDIVDGLMAHARDKGFAAIECLRLTPLSIRRAFADDQEYWLYQNGAHVTRFEMDGAVDLHGMTEDQLPMLLTGKCRNMVKQAERAGVRVAFSDDFPAFWTLLEETLSARHQAKPTHSLEEIMRLKEINPENIRLCAAYEGDRLIAGIVVVTLHDSALYTLYIAQDYERQAIHPVHAILFELLKTTLREKRTVLHLGVSTEEGGTVVNDGLFFFKESFGCRPVRRETWILPLR